jgi:dethiobiotin synthetase
MQPLLITGTDTGVGKTVVTAALAAYCQTYHVTKSLGIYKPIQAGEGDREYFHRTFQLAQTLAEITPIFFETPVAPAIASGREHKPVDLGKIWQQFQILNGKCDRLLVEAMGGLGSPITPEYIVADLARDWHLPTILVVPVRLGGIGQAVANVALAKAQKVNLKGIILSYTQPGSAQEIEDFTPIELIEGLTSIPVLGILPHIADLGDVAKLAQAASGLELERLGF